MHNIWVFGICIVGGAMVVAALGAFLARRLTITGQLSKHHEVAGYLLSVVGTLYSVLLGLVVVDTQTKYQQAMQMTQKEADSCVDMFHLSFATPLVVRRKIHNGLEQYLRIVTEDEWNSINSKSAFDESAKQAFRNLWWTLIDYEPQTSKEQGTYAKLLDIMQQAADCRRFRLVIGQTGLPPIMWGVLITGGCLTVLFTYLFEVEDVKAHMVLTSLVAMALSLNLLLIALFNNPYKGFMRVSVQPFNYDRKVMYELLKERPD